MDHFTVGGHQRPAVRGTVRFLRGRSVETSLEHADERDLIETFVERSRLALSSSDGDFQLGRISARDDGAREYNFSVTARMLNRGK